MGPLPDKVLAPPRLPVIGRAAGAVMTRDRARRMRMTATALLVAMAALFVVGILGGRSVAVYAIPATGLFMSAALPRAMVPPLFNRYDAADGHAFGNHVDNAIRFRADGAGCVRTDLSITVFLSNPADYDGDELVIEDSYGAHEVKLAAGDMILYPSSSLHRVEPVTRGSRVASFFWIESRVRDDAQRTILLDMDAAIRSLAASLGDDRAEVVSLTGCYHNLLRQWANG